MNIKEKLSEIKIISQVCTILDNMKKDHVSEFSAQGAYYVILSFIPFVILLITLIQYTDIGSDQLFDIISKIIPASMNDMVIGIVKEIYSKSIGTISVSLIFTLISADRGLFALNKGLNVIYKTKESKEKTYIYLKIKALLQTIIFILLIMLSLIVMVFGKTIISTMKENFGRLENYTIIWEILTHLVIMVTVFIILLFVYKFMSGYKIKLRKQIAGAIFASIAISIVSFIFSRFLEIFKGFSLTYGSLTTLMLIMMWTYNCFYMIFVGAEINKLQNRNRK